MIVVDWRPSKEQQEMLLEAIDILWDEADSPERAKSILELREELAGAPEVETP